MNRTDQNNTKCTSRKRSRAILSVFLIVAILIAGAYAFLSATDSKTNVFTVGNVDIELWERFDINLDGSLDAANELYDATQTSVSTDTDNPIVPGQTIFKQPIIKNVGKNSAYIFMAIGVPTALASDVESNNLNENINIEVKAFAVQEQYKNATNAISSWDAYSSVAKQNLGTTVDNTDVELFTLNFDNNSGWTECAETYRIAGYVYHFYVLDSAMAISTADNEFSTSPIESVTFNDKIGSGWVIPEGWTLTLANGTVYNSESSVSSDYVPSVGDVLESDDYTYKFQGASNFVIVRSRGWVLTAKDTTKTEYPEIPYGTIYGEPVLMSYTFSNCTNLIKSPKIPSGVTEMNSTFNNCTNLIEAPEIPDTVTQMDSTFSGCTSLTATPYIPKSVTKLPSAFACCKSLTTVSNIPNNVTQLACTFTGCSSLTQVPAIPEGYSGDLQFTFNGCTSLTSIPVLPSTVTSLNETFRGCTNLVSVVIPNGITNISHAFRECSSLITAEVPNTVDTYSGAFYGCSALTEITGTTTLKAELLATKGS